MTAVTGGYAAVTNASIINKRDRMTYKVNTTALTGTGPVAIRGGKDYPAEPMIYFTREAWVKQCHLVAKCTKEVGWFALVDYYEDDHAYVITEIVIPEQTVTAAETDIGKEALADAALALIEQGKDTGKMYAWFHSHVNMGVGPSAQDEYQVEEFLEDLVDQPEVPCFIRGIQNKKGDLKLDVYYVRHGIAYQNVRHGILHDDDPQWTKDIDDIIKINVKEYVYTPTPYVPRSYDYQWGGGQQQPAGKSSASHGNGGGVRNPSTDSYHNGYGGYGAGPRTEFARWNDDDEWGNTYGYDYRAEATDVPKLPKPTTKKFTLEDQYSMEIVYNGVDNTEVLMDSDGKLWVCDSAGDLFDYQEYTETYGELNGVLAFTS